MPRDPFSLVAEFATGLVYGAGSALGEYLMSRFIKTSAHCPNCGKVDDGDIENCATSHLACSKCSTWLDQYVNATNHTIGRSGAIAAAYICDIWWGNWKTQFEPTCDLSQVNAKGEDLVVRLTLSEFKGEAFHQKDKVVRPRFDRGSWKELTWGIPRRNFPEYPCAFAADVVVFNTWGDELYHRRTLGEYSGRRSSHDE